MDNDFALNKPGWYTTQVVAENQFLDDDQYGNKWYSVKFTGDANTFLWLAKERPAEDTAYYGHFEKTKSGKATRFKRDTEPEETKDRPAKATPKWQPKDERQVTKNMVWKNLLPYFDIQTMDFESEQWQRFWATIDLHTEMLLPAPLEESDNDS